MYSRHQFLSPDLKPVYPVSRPDRLLPSPVSHTLARYSSARMFERMTLPAPESEASLKKRIENYTYRTSNCIGEGYTSKVYKCSKDGSNETFAIKVVDLKKYSASNREMLESEVSIVRQLDHPNIIKCYDVMLTSNHCYIVTEFCEGGDLLALMKKVGKGRPLDQENRAKVMKDVLHGFRYLADKGIVHRDIKPANIFFKNGRCKIADFGFAKKVSQLRKRQSYNVGTPLYMPPQALLSNRYSLQSDIFSIGVLFYEMLYGISPWESRTEKQLVSKMNTQPLSFPRDLPARLKQFLEGCLAIDICKRLSTEQLFTDEFVQGVLANPQHQEEIFHSTLSLKSSNRQLSVKQLRPDSKSTSVQESSEESTAVTVNPAITPALTLHEVESTSTLHHKQAETCRRLVIDRNTSILLVQINLCRFMYYIAKNRLPHLRKIDKDRLNCVLYKHILKITDRLVDINRTNWLKLGEYDKYRTTSSFLKIHSTICDYHERYRRDFNQFREKMPWQYLQLVDSELTFLQDYEEKSMDRNFFRQVSSFIKTKVKLLSSTISIEARKPDDEREKGLSISIEALRSMLKYVSLLEMLANNFEDYEFFAQFSAITVYIDYGKSLADVDLYYELRDKANLLTI